MKRIHYLSYLRALACIAIVILHTVDAAVILYGDTISEAEKTASLCVVYCMMWAVPVFVMVTGALLLRKEKSITLKDVFGKYIFRIVVALLACCLIFSLLDTLMNKDGAGAGFLLRGLWNTLTGRGWSHLWYLYLLIGLYLLLVFYRMIARSASAKEYRYLLLVYAIFLSILPVFQLWNVKIGFYLHVSTIYPFYLFAGYGIAEGIVRIKRPVSILLIVVGLAGIILSTIWDAHYERVAYGNLLGYSSIFVLLLSCGVFALIKDLKGGLKISCTKLSKTVTVYEEKKPGFIGRVLLELDRCSFGVYLIHMVFIRLFLRYWKINPYEFGPAILIFAGLVVGSLIISYGITVILKLIPGVRKIV